MNRIALGGLLLVLASCGGRGLMAEESPYGKGLTEANEQRLVLDDMEDVSGWYNGSPEETTISTSDRHVAEGRFALKFANVVDHTKGEKNYPIGWPRTGKELGKAGLSDWSDYDFFECNVYVETSRAALPGSPLGIGFYHSGPQRSSSFPLGMVRKDAWTKIVIPIAQLESAADVQRVQLSISESEYKHGDRVDFFVDDMALTRLVEPAVARFQVDRKLLYANDRRIRATYTMMGRKDLEKVSVELAIGLQGEDAAAKVAGKAVRDGELTLPLRRPLTPGSYWARLGLRDRAGRLIDRSEVLFRVIEGPF
jgi:hypothetical protein